MGVSQTGVSANNSVSVGVKARAESTPRSAEDQTNRGNVLGAGCLLATETALPCGTLKQPSTSGPSPQVPQHSAV